MLKFVSRFKLKPEDFKSSLQNIKRCEDNINARVKNLSLSIDIVLADVSIASSDGVLENLTFSLRNISDFIRKRMALARDDEVVIRPVIHGNAPKHPLNSNFCENVYVKVREHVQRSTSRRMFGNETKGERILNFVRIVHV